MKSKPPRDRAASVRQRLLNIAKERGEEFNFVLVRYGLERLLFRLGQSRHAGTFVLKGAMLFPLWSGNPHRATKDMDLLGSGLPDIERFVDIFREMAAGDADDGVRSFPTPSRASRSARRRSTMAFGSRWRGASVWRGFRCKWTSDSAMPSRRLP